MNYLCGFLVTEEPRQIGNAIYHGVETNAWPIGDVFISEQAEDICEKAYADLSFPLLIDLSSALQYCIECKIQGIVPRLLYCEVPVYTPTEYPFNYHDTVTLSFLGYDYAYPSGSYFSAIANDVLKPNGWLSLKWKNQLNRFGLMTQWEEIDGFSEERLTLLHQISDHLLIEHGNFVVFRVYQVDNWELIDSTLTHY